MSGKSMGELTDASESAGALFIPDTLRTESVIREHAGFVRNFLFYDGLSRLASVAQDFSEGAEARQAMLPAIQSLGTAQTMSESFELPLAKRDVDAVNFYLGLAHAYGQEGENTLLYLRRLEENSIYYGKGVELIQHLEAMNQ